MVLDTASKMTTGVMVDAFVNSDAINARMVNGLIQGGYITRQERQNMVDRAENSNVEGSRLYASAFFAKRCDSLFHKPTKGLNLFVQAKHRVENYATFSKNALQLALFGNKSFAGHPTQFAPLSYTDMQFQQLQFGFAKNEDNLFSYYFGASVLIGQESRNLYTNSLQMYISPTGDTLQIGAIGRFEESNPSNNAFLGNNGIGASIDFGIQLPFQMLSDSAKPAKLDIAVSDVGFITWYNTAQRSTIDTAFSYYGTQFSNIFDPGAAIYYQDPGIFIDSLSNQTNESFTTNLPATVSVRLIQDYKQWQFYIQGTFRNNAYYKPFFAISGTRTISPHWKIGAQLNTGGYGSYGGGLFATYNTKGHTIHFGSHQIEGFLFPNKTAGQQLFLGYSFTI